MSWQIVSSDGEILQGGFQTEAEAFATAAVKYDDAEVVAEEPAELRTAAWGEEGKLQYDDDGRPIVDEATCGTCAERTLSL
jgi:hypothetical protein